MNQPQTRIHDCGDNLRHRAAARHHDGFARLPRAEFTKFRTIRAWMITLGAIVVVFVLLSFLSAFESRAPVGAVHVGPGGKGKTPPQPSRPAFAHSPLGRLAGLPAMDVLALNSGTWHLADHGRPGQAAA